MTEVPAPDIDAIDAAVKDFLETVGESKALSTEELEADEDVD